MNNSDNEFCQTDASFLASVKSAGKGKQKQEIDIGFLDLWPKTSKPGMSNCTSSDAYFYAQFTCEQSESLLHDKY